MNIAILGYGLEGKSTERYFKKYGDTVKVFDHFDHVDPKAMGLRDFDRVFRSPSVHPLPGEHNWTTVTNYFFRHCPCPIIGVTGTKGKGTTCSLITSLLNAFNKKTHLLGNIGKPALDVLDDINILDVVVYEMSSFQLWDLTKSPHIAVVLRIEPDHLNVHDDYDDYVSAKANIAKHQSKDDFCIYYQNNTDSTKIANQSLGTKLPYPTSNHREQLEQLLDNLQIPGPHNRENAEAALRAVAALLSPDSTFDDFISTNYNTLQQGLYDFQGLPHRIQFLRELNGVKYYDDNYSSAFPSTDVAIRTFENTPTVLIAGGLNKGADLSILRNRIFSAYNVKQTILIGSSAQELAKDQDPAAYQFADTLADAVNLAKAYAENLAAGIDNCLTDDKTPHEAVVLMSPGCASFDMFNNFSDRGDQYQALVNNLT